MVEIKNSLNIPDSEINFVVSRSGGPGGQNVNKVSTRVTLIFNLENSTSLTTEQKEIIKEKLGTRISKNGVLQVSSQAYRSQKANRDAVICRFADMIKSALSVSKKRRRTRIPKYAVEKRLEKKKNRSKIKQERKAPQEDE